MTTTWAIFLSIALLGAWSVRWRRWALAPVLLVWVIAVRNQLGYLGAGTDRGLLWHVFAAITTGLVIPIVVAVALRKRAQGRPGDAAA